MRRDFLKRAAGAVAGMLGLSGASESFETLKRKPPLAKRAHSIVGQVHKRIVVHVGPGKNADGITVWDAMSGEELTHDIPKKYENKFMAMRELSEGRSVRFELFDRPDRGGHGARSANIVNGAIATILVRGTVERVVIDRT